MLRARLPGMNAVREHTLRLLCARAESGGKGWKEEKGGLRKEEEVCVCGGGGVRKKGGGG